MFEPGFVRQMSEPLDATSHYLKNIQADPERYAKHGPYPTETGCAALAAVRACPSSGGSPSFHACAQPGPRNENPLVSPLPSH